MENQEEFIQWLADKLQAKDDEDLELKIRDLGQDGIKQAYDLFVRETDSDVLSAKDGGKLDYIRCLQQLKKGGKMKDCGCGGTISLKGKPKMQQGGIVINNKPTDVYAGIAKKPVVASDIVEFITPKGNKVYKGDYAMFNDAKNYGNWLDTWAAPDRPEQTAEDPTLSVSLGQGTNKMTYPTQVVRQAIQDNPLISNQLKFSNMSDYNKFQSELQQQERSDNTGIGLLRAALEAKNLGTKLIPKPSLASYAKGGKIDNATAVGKNHYSKKEDHKTGIIGAVGSTKKDGKSAVGLRGDGSKNDKTGLTYKKNSKKDGKSALGGYKISKTKDAKTGVVYGKAHQEGGIIEYLKG